MPKGNDGEADREALLALLERWRAATPTKDVAALLELVTEDVVFLPSSIPPIHGRGEVEKLYRAFFPRYREIHQDAAIEEIQIAGDWAFLYGTDELRLIPESGDAEIHMKGKGLSVLRREFDGAWRFWRGINNMTRVAGGVST